MTLEDMVGEIANPLEAARSRAAGELHSNRFDAISSGVEWSSVIYQIDDLSIARMSTVLGELRNGDADAHGGFWVSEENVKVDMDSSQATEMLENAIAIRLSIDQFYLEQRSEIAAAETVEQIAEIDIDF